MAGEHIRSLDDEKICLRLIVTRQRDGRQYNLPTASEVAALIVGDFDSTEHKRNIILYCQDDDFKRISELHPSYLTLHYLLFFPYGEDNYCSDIFHEGVTDYDEKNKGTRVTMKHNLLWMRTQMIESKRLTFNRKNDKDLRSEMYSKLATLAQNSESGVKLRGKKVILNSNFTGSPRYMMQNYLDAMTLCKFYGYPDLFITFTCNLNWPEITRFMEKRGLKSEDRPDVISRVFKIKLDCLMKELNDGHIFGRVKRGLPHCHILLWIETEDNITTTGKIDEYISAEIPNKDEDPELYQLVTDHMMHGPCGADNPSCPCRIEYKCTKKFPRQFNETTVIDDSGYALYKIRNYRNIIKKSGTDLPNGYVVPYIPGLLRRYQAHINVEWTPSIEQLPFHLKDEQQVIFDATKSIDYAVDKSYVNETKFKKTKNLDTEKARPMEWDDLKKVDDVLYPTYRDACYARGLLQDDKEYIDGILEAKIVWEKTWMKLAEDVLNVERIKHGIPDLELSDIQRKNICLSYIECMLRSNNRSLKDIHNMPYPDQECTMDGYNRLIYDETSYDKDQLQEQHVKLYGSLTTEQKCMYSTVMDAVDNNKGGMFFIYGYGGTGKTYLYKTMSVALHFKGDIVLNVASSGIVALLLEGERTAHSRFAIPINVVEDSMCHIAAVSDLDDLIRKANLIIWDEATMINMHYYEAFDRTLQDICRTDPSVASDKVFEGKVVLFGGDFRQILPVITNGGRQDVVNATINSSYLWEKCNGKVGGANDGESTIVFPDNMFIPETDDDVGVIIDDTYPNLLQNPWNPSFFQEKAILSPTHEMVDIINKRMLSLLLGDENEYESSDSVCLADEDSNFDNSIYTIEFLNGLRMYGIPNHSIKLKIGGPYFRMDNYMLPSHE
nr:DNA helicase PIF1, ATP-dependent [Tanacetum cinerariifolium]